MVWFLPGTFTEFEYPGKFSLARIDNGDSAMAMRALPDYVQRTAFELALHEAGHACIASLLGAAVHSVSIKTRADQSGLDGEALIDYGNLSDRDSLAVIFAGVAADVALGQSADDDTEGDESDSARLTQISLRFGADAATEFYAATRRAEKYVVMVRSEIIALARALAAAPFIDGVATIAGEELTSFLPVPRWSPWR